MENSVREKKKIQSSKLQEKKENAQPKYFSNHYEYPNYKTQILEQNESNRLGFNNEISLLLTSIESSFL